MPTSLNQGSPPTPTEHPRASLPAGSRAARADESAYGVQSERRSGVAGNVCRRSRSKDDGIALRRRPASARNVGRIEGAANATTRPGRVSAVRHAEEPVPVSHGGVLLAGLPRLLAQVRRRDSDDRRLTRLRSQGLVQGPWVRARKRPPRRRPGCTLSPSWPLKSGSA